MINSPTTRRNQGGALWSRAGRRRSPSRSFRRARTTSSAGPALIGFAWNVSRRRRETFAAIRLVGVVEDADARPELLRAEALVPVTPARPVSCARRSEGKSLTVTQFWEFQQGIVEGCDPNVASRRLEGLHLGDELQVQGLLVRRRRPRGILHFYDGFLRDDLPLADLLELLLDALHETFEPGDLLQQGRALCLQAFPSTTCPLPAFAVGSSCATSSFVRSTVVTPCCLFLRIFLLRCFRILKATETGGAKVVVVDAVASVKGFAGPNCCSSCRIFSSASCAVSTRNCKKKKKRRCNEDRRNLFLRSARSSDLARVEVDLPRMQRRRPDGLFRHRHRQLR